MLALEVAVDLSFYCWPLLNEKTHYNGAVNRILIFIYVYMIFIFKFFIYYFVWMTGAHMCCGTHVEVRGQLCRVGLFLPPLCGFWGSNPVNQVCKTLTFVC